MFELLDFDEWAKPFISKTSLLHKAENVEPKYQNFLALPTIYQYMTMTRQFMSMSI